MRNRLQIVNCQQFLDDSIGGKNPVVKQPRISMTRLFFVLRKLLLSLSGTFQALEIQNRL